MYLVAGFFAYVFALGELGLVRFRMPTYSGAYPMFIQRQQDIIKALLLGLFLGNIGIGCPHPATPVILTRIAVSGSVFYGWSLFLIHAIGRVLPLLLLAILGILGVNALQSLVRHKEKIERATGWGMVFVAAFIFTLGLFSHDWWVNSGQHVLFEEIVQEQRFTNLIADNLNVANVHTHGMIQNPRTLFGLPWQLGNWVLVFLWMLPFWWYYTKQKKALPAMPEEEKKIWTAKLPLLFWSYTLLTAVLFVMIVYFIPFRFLAQSGGVGMQMMHSSVYHEARDVTQGVGVDMKLSPVAVNAGSSTRIDFLVNEKPNNIPLSISLLDVNHAKYMHVLGIRDDMNEFFHIHPHASTTRGVMTIDHTFAKPGNYKIWAEVTESGMDHIYGQVPTRVIGTDEWSNKRVLFERSVVVDGRYQVRLNTVPVVGRRRTENLSFEIHDKQGREVRIE
ncbi:MAG: cytochrome c biogenesis protein CcdA, partial [Patescibacteria group bacterium]